MIGKRRASLNLFIENEYLLVADEKEAARGRRVSVHGMEERKRMGHGGQRAICMFIKRMSRGQ